MFTEHEASTEHADLADDPPRVVDVPSDFLRPPVRSRRTDVVRRRLPADADLSIDSEGPVLVALLTALHGHTGQSDLSLALPTGLLRVTVDPSRTFDELGEALREAEREGLEDASGSQISFRTVASSSEPGHQSTGEPNGDFRDLAFELCLEDAELSLRYQTDLFIAKTADRLLGHVLRVLEQGTSDGSKPVGRLELLTSDERQAAVVDWNATELDFPRERCLHELFAQQVERDPQAPAVITPAETLTYGELAERVHRLARTLRDAGVRPGSLVGVCLDRTANVPVALLGILQAGCAYLPLDPTYPTERLSYLLDDAGPEVLVTEERLLERLPEHRSHRILLDAHHKTIAAQPSEPLQTDVEPDFPVYVIYTSGSTGKPKGVMLDHRGRVNNFTDFNRRYRVGPGDRVLGVSSLSFDMSAYDVLGTLASGAALVFPEAARERDPSHWAELMIEHRVTLWHSVPALLEMLIDYAELKSPKAPATLKTVLLGGDWIPVSLPDRLRALASDAQVVSLGGATEASMDSTIFPIEEVDPEWRSIPYGVPMTNQLAYILDPEGRLCPVGVPGELHLGGIGLAWGYHKRPSLTADRFIPNPWSRVPGDRLYRTGDLARYRADGTLILLGRLDFQIKIRGLRIELGEIEALLKEQDGVGEALVAVREDARGDKQLVAYVTADDELPTFEQLRQRLRDRLPEAMVPSALVALDALPLTPNGKVDRRNLPAPQADADQAPYAPPEGPVETALVTLMSDVLGLEKVGRDDDFFRLGGHSLLGVRLLWQAKDAIGREVPLPWLMAHPTPRKLAATLAAEGRSNSPIRRSNRRRTAKV